MWNWREDAVAAPSCKRCLAILDKQFAQPAPAERLGWNVIRAMEQLGEWGCVHVVGVPADQAELLRTRLRAEARQRSENALSPAQRGLVMAESMQRMQALHSGAELEEPSWRFPWS